MYARCALLQNIDTLILLNNNKECIKMKIAILTQPLGKNYGGIIQAYALQQVLIELGHEPTTVNRFSKIPLYIKALMPAKPLIYKVLGRKYYKNLSKEQEAYVYGDMKSFISNYMSFSKPILNTKDLKRYFKKGKFDIAVVGSDQVWRPKYSPDIYNYFGDFLGNKKQIISYAASFGVDNWEFTKKQTDTCKKLVKKFKAVSVRESSAIDLCHQYLGADAELVLDPALLLRKDDYQKVISSCKGIKKNSGILTYILDRNETKTEIVSYVKHKLKKETFSAQPKRLLDDTSSKNIEDYKYPPVEQWLSSFKDADFIVTDSFHGTAFSVIFNKPFIAIGNAERGLSRFKSILGLLGLEERLILDTDTDKIDTLINQEIDWSNVNSVLSDYKEKSKSFLRKAL